MAILKNIKWLTYILMLLFLTASCKYNSSKVETGEYGTVIEQISYSNHAEVELGQLASRNGEDSTVRAYAEMMVDEHKKAQEDLDSLADERNIDLPGTPKDTHQQLKDSLNNLSGQAFDSAYIQSQIRMHTATIDLFESISDTVQDQNLKNFVDKYLPAIKMHRMKADSIADILNAEKVEV